MSLSASEAVIVAAAFWFSGTVNKEFDVKTGRLSFIFEIDISPLEKSYLNHR